MSNKHLITFQGKTLPLSEWCRKYGFKYHTFYRRFVQKKLNIKDALFLPLRGKKRNIIKSKRGMKLRAFGKSQTANEWAKETGLKVDTIQDRIRNGWSVEEAVSIKPLSHGCNRNYEGVTAFGQTKSITKWAREYGIAPNTVRRRLALGFGLEYALKIPTEHSKRKTERG